MLNIEQNILAELDALARRISGRAELYEGENLVQIFNSTDNLKSLSVERQGTPGKFFGFGVSHKLTLKLVDNTRALNISNSNTLEVELGAGADMLYFSPLYYIADVQRDENTNELTVTAHDALHKAKDYTVAELDLPAEGYTLHDVVVAIARLLGLPFKLVNIDAEELGTYYPGGANFEGTETVRSVLDMLAEVTQTIYYISNNWELTFKRLDKMNTTVYSIDRSRYFTLKAQEPQTLGAVTHCTEIGDNVTAASGSGAEQYVRNNAFWELRDDIGDLVNAALDKVGGTTITPIECTWRGNFALEVGDKIDLTTKDLDLRESFVLSDTITYNGALSQTTKWSKDDSTGETASNPSNLGEVLKQTYARVDKANKTIELVASETANNAEELAALRINTNRMEAAVHNLEREASATMTAEQIELSIKQAVENDVKKVTTETGFTFDKDGLTVSKSDSEMSTQITEDGMQVFKGDDAVLTADNAGVSAQNLHATTYIIIGKNSRLETYNDDRTACFWIGE